MESPMQTIPDGVFHDHPRGLIRMATFPEAWNAQGEGRLVLRLKTGFFAIGNDQSTLNTRLCGSSYQIATAHKCH